MKNKWQMNKFKEKPRLLGKQVWCSSCIKDRPPTIKKAEFLIPVRTGHYDLLPDQSQVDMRVIGICKKCLKKKNTFQKNNTEPVNVDHKHLVYSCA